MKAQLETQKAANGVKKLELKKGIEELAMQWETRALTTGFVSKREGWRQHLLRRRRLRRPN